jgi:hypothetical protein
MMVWLDIGFLVAHATTTAAVSQAMSLFIQEIGEDIPTANTYEA